MPPLMPCGFLENDIRSGIWRLVNGICSPPLSKTWKMLKQPCQHRGTLAVTIHHTHARVSVELITLTCRSVVEFTNSISRELAGSM